MEEQKNKSLQAGIDLGTLEILPVFDQFSEGVIIVDATGVIKYYNKAMASIDDIYTKEAVNKKVTDLYDLDQNTSKIMQCLELKKPIVNHAFLYKTRKGRIANTIHNVYPLFQQGLLDGAVCFVKEYNVLENTLSTASIPADEKNNTNGTRFSFANIISDNIEYLNAVSIARQTAQSPSPIMLSGETGTGKELFAQAIHNKSFKAGKQYIPINCSAIPANLLEGILFGTTKGAFTGAVSKPGLFEKANGGSLFLDEVDSMDKGLQAKILRVIQERKVRRLGSFEEKQIQVKIISSISKPPEHSLRIESLRQDLFYRLGVVLISIPPLREHMDDIEKLVDHFISKHSFPMNKKIAGISDEVMNQLYAYHWPGNIRELEHVIESAINMVEEGQCIEKRHLKSCFINIEEKDHDHASSLENTNADNRLSLKEMNMSREKDAITKSLEANFGNIAMTARNMGVSRQLLYYKIKKHNIKT